MTNRSALLVCLAIIACVPLAAVLGVATWHEVAHATVYGCAAFAGLAWAWLAGMRQKIERRRGR